MPLEQEPRNEKPRDTVKGSRLAFRGHKTQYVAGLIILAIIIAVVGGSLGGTLGRKSRYVRTWSMNRALPDLCVNCIALPQYLHNRPRRLRNPRHLQVSCRRPHQASLMPHIAS